MTVYLDGEDVRALATHELTMAAASAAVRADAEGQTVLPPRLDLDLARGFLRTMPAALAEVMGLKVMTLVKGVGNRYLILLYSQVTGELLAVLDAGELTRLRTAATTAVAGQRLAPRGTERLGLVGSGFEAEGHLRTLARVWPLKEVRVYSPSPERRAAFCVRLGDELGASVLPVESATAAIEGAEVSVLATKSDQAVVDGAAFPSGAVVLSIGSTRPDLRELDRATFRRVRVLLTDDIRQLALESGDVIDALGCDAISTDRIVPMSAQIPVADGPCERDLLAFKSTGTAVQDLALASELLTAAVATGRGRDIGELARLKPFAAPPPDTLSAIAEGSR